MIQTGLSALTFAHPAALWFLLALPVIAFLLRATPPRPATVRFAPFRLLQNVRKRREEAARTPWWLILLRMALMAALIIAVAGPRLDPQRGGSWNLARGKGPVLVIVDDGWAAANAWTAVTNTFKRLLDEAGANDRPVILATTAPQAMPLNLKPQAPRALKAALATLKPRPFAPQRLRLLNALRASDTKPADIIWLADGLDYGDAGAFAEGLSRLGAARVTVHALPQDALPHVLLKPTAKGGKITAPVLRPRRRGMNAMIRQEQVRILLRARNGRPLAEATATFRGTALKAWATLTLPAALRNEAAMLTIAGEDQAAAVWLFDDRFRHRSVLVYSGETRGRDQPLLSPAYYVIKALQPQAEVNEAETLSDLDSRLDPSLSMLVLADVGRLDASRRERIKRWVRAGGLLLRFAGPRLAAAARTLDPDLVPVRLRASARQLGAVLSWEQPQPLQAFPAKSPFADLKHDPDIRISRQVLAEPDPDLSLRTWALLADGTPLITARREGKGRVILVHVTASPEWSNLPMTGLFVDILDRILEMAPPARIALAGEAQEVHDAAAPSTAMTASSTAEMNAGPFVPLRTLDGFGRLQPPPPQAAPISPEKLKTTRPGPEHPPGLYGRGGMVRALNVGQERMKLAVLPPLPSAFDMRGYARLPVKDLAPPLFLAAAVLFLLDGLALLVLSGGLGLLLPRSGQGKSVLARMKGDSTARILLPLFAITLIAAFSLPINEAAAAPENGAPQTVTTQETATRKKKDDEAALAFALRATARTRFAYVKTGDPRVDRIARAGLIGLSEFLAQRTSVEPGEPFGIDIEKDEIAFFPLIYWPVTADAPLLSAQAVARIDTYLKNGGTILFDTRDADAAALNPGGLTPERQALRRILSSLDIPPLEPTPRTHVLTRSFYLLSSFPGRYASSPLWVEATSAGRERRRLSVGNADGVSSILITGNDMAAAWAITPSGNFMMPVSGTPRQREMAIRAGINIVMYALTGNYKADQVHIPIILRRLGQ